LSPSWEAANCAATQELPSILWNPKVHVHTSPPLVPILSQIDPVHIIPSYLSKIYFNIVHPSTSWSSHRYPICKRETVEQLLQISIPIYAWMFSLLDVSPYAVYWNQGSCRLTENNVKNLYYHLFILFKISDW
jgi:hypothetical protein